MPYRNRRFLNRPLHLLSQCVLFSLLSPSMALAEEPVKEAQPKKAPPRLRVFGFLETRLTNYSNSNGNRGPTLLQVTRLRPTISYAFDDHFRANLQFNLTTRGHPINSDTGRDVYLEYRNAGYQLRIGQTKIPFGYEIYQEGDEVRAPLERARLLGTLFPDERDIGIFFATTPKNKMAATYAIGLISGNGIDKRIERTDKSFAMRVLVPLPHDQNIGASWYSGTSRPGGTTVEFVKNAFGLEYRKRFSQWSFQAEYLWGRGFGGDLHGGYLEADYSTKHHGTLFARHEIYDPNIHAAQDMWDRTSLGWYKDWGNLRLTGEYDIVHNARTPTSDDTYGVEVQLKF